MTFLRRLFRRREARMLALVARYMCSKEAR